MFAPVAADVDALKVCMGAKLQQLLSGTSRYCSIQVFAAKATGSKLKVLDFRC